MPKPEPMSAEELAYEVWSAWEISGQATAAELIESQFALIRQAAREEGRREASQWRTLRDRTPPIDKYHLFRRGNHLPFVGLWDVDMGCLVNGELCRPTHWMPIPELPGPPAAPCTACRSDAVCGEDIAPCLTAKPQA